MGQPGNKKRLEVNTKAGRGFRLKIKQPAISGIPLEHIWPILSEKQLLSGTSTCPLVHAGHSGGVWMS